MKKSFSSKKSAFSLIELSIVLIVIGLLIAGITGGASLIKSSELRSVMSEARGYSVSVNAFYSQFNALPGDYSTAVGSQSSYFGDNDGKIEFANVDTIDAESNVAWYALKQIGAIADNLEFKAVSSALSPGDNFPSSKIKSSGWIFSYIDNQNTVVLTGPINAGTAATNEANNIATPSLIPSDALAIDTKIDDGIANTGKVRGSIINSTTCYNSGTYVIGGTDKTCALSYQVDVSS